MNAVVSNVLIFVWCVGGRLVRFMLIVFIWECSWLVVVLVVSSSVCTVCIALIVSRFVFGFVVVVSMVFVLLMSTVFDDVLLMSMFIVSCLVFMLFFVVGGLIMVLMVLRVVMIVGVGICLR